MMSRTFEVRLLRLSLGSAEQLLPLHVFLRARLFRLRSLLVYQGPDGYRKREQSQPEVSTQTGVRPGGKMRQIKSVQARAFEEARGFQESDPGLPSR